MPNLAKPTIRCLVLAGIALLAAAPMASGARTPGDWLGT